MWFEVNRFRKLFFWVYSRIIHDFKRNCTSWYFNVMVLSLVSSSRSGNVAFYSPSFSSPLARYPHSWGTSPGTHHCLWLWDCRWIFLWSCEVLVNFLLRHSYLLLTFSWITLHSHISTSLPSVKLDQFPLVYQCVVEILHFQIWIWFVNDKVCQLEDFLFHDCISVHPFCSPVGKLYVLALTS